MRRPVRALLLALPLVAALSACATAPEGSGAGRPVAASRDAPAAAPERITLASWPAQGPTRAVILALHGFGDAGELTFADAARAWSARGIAVYAPDQRGFGANPSQRRWPGPAALADDAAALAAELRRRHPGVPLTVVGHSMGGGVALLAASRGLDADRLVLAGPAIAGGDALNPALRAGALALAVAAPERRWTGEGIVRIRPTDNDAAIRRVAGDPRHFGDPSSRELWGLVRLMDAAAAAAPGVTLPALTLMGAHDEVLRPDRVRRVHDGLPAGAGFRLYPEGWHWLFRDLQADRVWRDVAEFALAPSG